MRLFLATGVGMLAGLPCAVFPYRQRNLPDLASTPTRPFCKNCTYCFTPAASTMMIDAYAASSPSGTAHFQMTSPLLLFSATIVASVPPGVQTTASPSTSGDSAYAQLPGAPPKSSR